MPELKPQIKIDDLYEDALWRWCADMVEWGATVETEEAAEGDVVDVVLSTKAATRFAVQVDPDGGIALGVPEADVAAFASVEWTGAAFVRGEGGCFALVVAEDVALRDSQAAGAVKLRIFLPMPGAMLEAFEGVGRRPERLRLRAMRVARTGAPLFAVGEPRAELPLTFRNEERQPVPQPALKGKGKKPPRPPKAGPANPVPATGGFAKPPASKPPKAGTASSRP